eukprot:gene8038-12504_t
MKIVFGLLLLVLVSHPHIEAAGLTCRNEETELEEIRKLDQLQVCGKPSTTSCYHKDKISQYPNKLNVLVPIVFYGVDCSEDEVAAYELGHGFGLRHTFFRTTAPISSCDCAENSNTPDHFRGDYCADTPGFPLTSSTSKTISTSKLSNGCPKNETFWNNHAVENQVVT